MLWPSSLATTSRRASAKTCGWALAIRGMAARSTASGRCFFMAVPIIWIAAQLHDKCVEIPVGASVGPNRDAVAVHHVLLEPAMQKIDEAPHLRREIAPVR